MRKVVSGLFMSIDGVVAAPNEWQFAFDEEMGAAMNAMLENQDAVLLGRVTYSEWAGYWPTSTDEPFASWINNTPKYVASTTLDTLSGLEWQNSTLFKGDLAEEITALKAQDGKNIGTAGSPGLIRSLLELDLLDELVLMVSPVIAGSGARLADGGALSRMELISSAPTSSGTVILTYRPAR